MLAVTAGGLLLVTWIATKAVLFFLQEAPILSQPIGKGMSLHRGATLNWERSMMRQWSWTVELAVTAP